MNQYTILGRAVVEVSVEVSAETADEAYEKAARQYSHVTFDASSPFTNAEIEYYDYEGSDDEDDDDEWD